MDELFEQFMIEGRELISTATDDLAALEQNPAAPGRVDSAFRAVHTLKGSVAIFDLKPMGVALHAAEELLDSVRSGTVAATPAIANALLGCLDQCDRWMDAVEEGAGLPIEASRDAVRLATGLLALTGSAQGSDKPDAAVQREWLAALLERQSSLVEDARKAGTELTAIRYGPRADCFFAGDDPMAFVASVPDLVALEISAVEPWPELEAMDPYSCNLLIEMVTSASAIDVGELFRFVPDQVEILAVPKQSGPATDTFVSPIGAEAQRTIRVDAAQIDRLLALVGELVVAKNGLAHLAARVESGTDAKAVAADIRSVQATTDRLIGDMHQAVMNVRMVPLERVFRRLMRMVRELAERLDRDVAFKVTGEGTRVDKAVADILFEPLLHIVRNALDHGIKPPATRRSAGKQPKGRLSLSARTLGDQILIEVTDDGAGIDPDKVRKVAADRAVLAPDQLQALDDVAAMQLIFAPGFSTAASVTDVSGRGVGMDAVKASVEQLGGRVSVSSKLGSGTVVSLRLPATAALTTILAVNVGTSRFAVPLEVISETVRVPAQSIKAVGLGRAFVLRDQTLPVIHLATLLGIAADGHAEDLKILVIDAGQDRIGIAVDDFSERLNVMVRPMTGLLANMPGVSGSTLIGDGSVLLILNLAELIG